MKKLLFSLLLALPSWGAIQLVSASAVVQDEQNYGLSTVGNGILVEFIQYA
jgi:hypothetical protein